MKRLLHRLFCLYPGEARNAVIFSGLAFLWSLIISSGLEFSDALFLVRVGSDSLPLAYGLTATFMLPLALLFLHSFHRFGVYRTYLAIISLGILFYSSTYALLRLRFLDDISLFWYALKIFGYIFFSFGLTSYWTFVDQYHHIRESKRIYTFFSTLIFLGMATTGFIMRSAFFSLEQLFLFLIGLIACISLIARKIHHYIPLITHEETEQETIRSGQTFALPSLVRSILQSRIALALLAGNFLMQLCSVITEYNYFFAFESHFSLQDAGLPLGEGTEAELTKFLGKLVFSVSFFNVIFGFFLYSRLARSFGIGALLPVTPVLLVFIFSGWLFDNTLFFPICGFFITDGTNWLLDDNNFNLTLNAVPSKLKYKIRVAIESFFEPIAMITSAIILHFMGPKSKVFGLLLATLWIGVTFIIRTEYLKGIFHNLSENAIHFTRTTKEWLLALRPKQRHVAELRMLAIVKHEDPEAKILACKGLLSLDDASILEKLLSFAQSMGLPEKIRFLDLLGKSSFALHPIVLNTLENWLREEADEDLQGTIFFYLAQRGLLHPEKAIDHLQNPHLLFRAAAIASLKKSGGYLTPVNLGNNRAKALQGLQKLLTSSNPEEICMGVRIFAIDAPPSDVDVLIPYLKHPHIAVSRTAAKAVMETINSTCRRHASTLFDFLSITSDHEVRSFCLQAIGKLEDTTYGRNMILASHSFRPHERRLVEKIIIGMGLKTVPMLLQLTSDTTVSDRCRLLAGRILGTLSVPQLRARLKSIVKTEIERAYFYFYHAQTVQKETPQHDLSFLTHTLHTGYHSAIDFIIQLLAIAGEVQDEELLAHSLRSRNPKVRNQAIEAIERTCDPEIFGLLQLLIEDVPNEEKMAAYLSEGRKPLHLEALLDKLDHSSAQVDQIIAATYKYRLNLPGWREALRKRMASKEEIFHHFAYELLEE